MSLTRGGLLLRSHANEKRNYRMDLYKHVASPFFKCLSVLFWTDIFFHQCDAAFEYQVDIKLVNVM